MANYEFAVASMRTGKVKNPEEVVNVFLAVGYEETYADKDGDVFIGGFDTPISDENIVIINSETNKVVAVADCYGDYRDVETGEEIEDIDEDRLNAPDSIFKSQEIFDYLKEQLLDGEVIAIVEAGWEKLRSVGATAVVISKQGIYWNSTYGFIEETIEKLKEKNNEEVNS